MSESSTAVVPFEEGQFTVLHPEQGAAIREAIAENLGDQQLRLLDLPRITVPAGGGTSWEKADMTTGQVESVKSIQGVLVSYMRQRLYFASSFEEEPNVPPACVSVDGVTGTGDPGGSCEVCPMAQFGSHRGGRGQACSEVGRIAVLEPGVALPLIINVPPTSLRPLKNYNLGLATKGIRRSRVVTAFELEATKNADGLKMSVIAPKLVGVLQGDEATAMDEYAGTLRGFLEAQPPSFDRGEQESQS